MYRSTLRRAFKPPNFIDKPHSEKSKVHESQDLTLTSKQTAAQDVSKCMQPVKRRKLLVCPVSLTPPTAIQMQKGPPVLPASCPDPGRPVAFPTVTVAPTRAKEVSNVPHSIHTRNLFLPGTCMWLRTSLNISCCCNQEKFNKGYSRLGTTAEPENGSPAKSLPELLPSVHIERSSPVLGASMSLPGQVKLEMMGDCRSCQHAWKANAA